jgi:ribosomal-protein-alanine N-acetyltransferase
MIMVRAALLADADALAAIHGASFAEGWSAADLAGWIGRNEAFAMAAETAGEILGFGLALAAGDDAELLTIASRPGRRRSGAGRAIFRALNAEAGRRGLTRWVLEAAETNSAALALYRSEGFVEIGRRKGYYRQEAGAVDAIVMARPAGLRDLDAAGAPGGQTGA